MIGAPALANRVTAVVDRGTGVFKVQLEENIALGWCETRCGRCDLAQRRVFHQPCAPGDKELAAAAARILHRTMHGIATIALEIVALRRGWFHEQEQVPFPDDRRDRVDARRAIAANRRKIGDGAACEACGTECSQFGGGGFQARRRRISSPLASRVR